MAILPILFPGYRVPYINPDDPVQHLSEFTTDCICGRLNDMEPNAVEEKLQELLDALPRPISIRSSCNLMTLLYSKKFCTLKLVQIMTNAGLDLTVRDPREDRTPLHIGVNCCTPEVLDFMLRKVRDNGLDFNNRVRWPLIPLALDNPRSADILPLLLDNGITLMPDDLFAGRGENRLANLRLLLNHLDVNTRDERGKTLLSRAITSNNIEQIRFLIEHEADINARNLRGKTPQNTATLNFLLELGIDETPLHVAMASFNLEVITILLEAGADITATTKKRNTVLHCAAMTITDSLMAHPDHRAILAAVKILIEHGADVNARNLREETPLHIAIKYGKLELANLLIEHGADVNARNLRGETPLHIADKLGNFDLADLLIEHRADVGDRAPCTLLPQSVCYLGSTTTPLALPKVSRIETRCERSPYADLDAITERLARGDDIINTPINSPQGETLLHMAAINGNLDVLQCLLDNGANVNAQTLFGDTPLRYAVLYMNDNIVAALLDRRARVDIENKQGRTAMDAIKDHRSLLPPQMAAIHQHAARLDLKIRAIRTLLQNHGAIEHPTPQQLYSDFLSSNSEIAPFISTHLEIVIRQFIQKLMDTHPEVMDQIEMLPKYLCGSLPNTEPGQENLLEMATEDTVEAFLEEHATVFDFFMSNIEVVGMILNTIKNRYIRDSWEPSQTRFLDMPPLPGLYDPECAFRHYQVGGLPEPDEAVYPHFPLTALIPPECWEAAPRGA